MTWIARCFSTLTHISKKRVYLRCLPMGILSDLTRLVRIKLAVGAGVQPEAALAHSSSCSISTGIAQGHGLIHALAKRSAACLR
jgi:hypothetical protein